MKVFSDKGNEVILGTGEEKLLHLIETKSELNSKQGYELFHFALLLPSKETFANIFKHFIDKKIPLEGGSNHGYSQALYLNDLEGNGIEIYYDKEVSEWNIREDGRIVGITEELDANYFYTLGNSVENYELPQSTTMGHIHLSVNDSQASSKFYQEVFRMGDKHAVPSTSRIASGTYHHHLAVNQWGGKNLLSRVDGMPGLAYYTVVYNDKIKYDELLSRLENNEVVVQQTEEFLVITDRDGIKTKVVLEK